MDIRSRGSSSDVGWERGSLRLGDDPTRFTRYVPTPIVVVRKMLELAEAGSEDVVFDLGCGDGRILLTAVEEFGVKKAVGFELDPVLCESARAKVETRGLRERVEVINGDLFHADLSPASLVTLYLTTLVNQRLRPKLEDELRDGTRVTSHDFPIKSWETAKHGRPSYYAIGLRRIYLYRIPEAYRRAKQGPETHGEKSLWSRAMRALRP